MLQWDRYPDFTEKEMACSHCGKTGVTHSLMKDLQALRSRIDRPLTVTSGYRCPEHPIEAKKARPGAHGQGTAVDLRAVTGSEKYELMKLAFQMGFAGIATAQTFIHLDVGHSTANRPASWSY
tara:strand:- start:1322 stop:1690 length:369 start_codon:yes stop_codon:yes gene_type:complete